MLGDAATPTGVRRVETGMRGQGERHMRGQGNGACGDKGTMHAGTMGAEVTHEMSRTGPAMGKRIHGRCARQDPRAHTRLLLRANPATHPTQPET